MERKARLTLFYGLLEAAPAACTHDEALALLTSALTSIEDEYSGAPNNPEKWRTDGRMYPPQIDSVRQVEGFPNVVRYRTLNHNTFIARNGAIEIRHAGTDQIEFAKNGANGKEVWNA